MNKSCCIALLAVTAACTPALNWRDVAVDRLRVNLPCKPDRAQRPVLLQNTSLELDMAGCEAAGALFAVSHVKAPAGSSAKELLGAWQLATLENMQIKNAAAALASYNSTLDNKANAAIGQVEPLQASGTNANGRAVQARLVWFVSGNDIYHLALYADTFTSEITEPLFSQAKLQ